MIQIRTARLVLPLLFVVAMVAACTETPEGDGNQPDAFVPPPLHQPDGGSEPGDPDAAPDATPVPTFSCTGVPETCAAQSGSTFACTNMIGCTQEPDSCSGVPTSCFSFFSSFSCSSQPGCFWSSTSNFCSGSVHSCSFESTLSGCFDIQGCNWSFGACTGFPEACSTITDLSDCIGQRGCDWTQNP